MTVLELLRILARHIRIILLATLISALAAGLVSWYMLDNVYQASATIIVSSQKAKQDMNTLTYNDYTLNLKLVNSYQVLCKTNRILDQVIKQTGLSCSLDQLKNMITVAAVKDTEIISISVLDRDPAVARNIANALADVFQKEVVAIMKMDNVQVIDYAPLPAGPVLPRRMQNVLLAALAGLTVGIGIAFLLDRLDFTVKDSVQAEEIIDAPVLGSIPHID